MEMLNQQRLNEAFIKLTVLLYQIDGKVTLTELDYFDELLENMEWQSGICKEAFVSDTIHSARDAIDAKEHEAFLWQLADELNMDPSRSLEIAMDITGIDGKRSDSEIDLLALLSNRILARGLVA